MKTSSNFKMKKEMKRGLATFTDPARRSVYKELMVDAWVSFEKAKREALRSKRNNNEAGEE